MRTVEGIFFSSEATIRFTFSGPSVFGLFNQPGPLSHSLFLSFSILIALVPKSARLLLLLTCFRCETSVVSSISAARSATNTCFFRWELCIHCNTVVESDQNLQLNIFISCSLTICPFKLTSTLHFLITNAKSIEYFFWLRILVVPCPHRLFRSVCKHLTFGFYPSLFRNISYRCLFQLQHEVVLST